MKYCSKCGLQNDDSNSFCMQCGENFSQNDAGSSSTNPEQQSQGTQDTYYHPEPQVGYGYSNPNPTGAMGYLKQIASSQLFLAAAITLTAYIILEFLSSITYNNSLIQSYLYDIMYDSYYYYDLVPYLNTFLSAGTSPLSALWSLGPDIVLAIGLWMIYSSAKNINTQAPATAGFTVVRVITIIKLVFLCIGFGIIDLLLLFLAFVMFSASDIAALGGGLILILFVIVTALFILNIIYYKKTLDIIKNSVNAIRMGEPIGKPSMYLIVMNFIFAFFAIFSLFIHGIAGGIASACNMASIIIMTILLLKVRKDIDMNVVQPGYQTQQSQSNQNWNQQNNSNYQ